MCQVLYLLKGYTALQCLLFVMEEQVPGKEVEIQEEQEHQKDDGRFSFQEIETYLVNGTYPVSFLKSEKQALPEKEPSFLLSKMVNSTTKVASQNVSSIVSRYSVTFPCNVIYLHA